MQRGLMGGDPPPSSPAVGTEFTAGNIDAVLKLTLPADSYTADIIKADGTPGGTVIYTVNELVNR
jgi:hypothetical protein